MAGVDPSFGLNSFNQPKYKNESETIATAVLNLLFGKPGFFPSMPDLGINIQETIYMFWDEINVDTIKAKIIAQCSTFKPYILDGSFDIIKSSYKNQPLLIVSIPVQIKNESEQLIIGVTQDKNGNTEYNYVFDKTIY